MKITPDAPKNESGLAQMIKMGKSIRQIWVNVEAAIHVKTVLQFFEACEVEPMLFVFKTCDLIGHDHIISLKLCFNVSQFIR